MTQEAHHTLVKDDLTQPTTSPHTPHSTAWITCVVCALVCLITHTAHAQDEDASDQPLGYAGVDLGFGQVDEDFFTLTRLHASLETSVFKVGCSGWFPDITADKPLPPPASCKTPLRLSANLLLRWRTIDRNPLQDGQILRKEDWDEPGDWGRIIRFLEYGRRYDPLYVRLGQLNAVVLGNGTIMNGYFNVIDVDHNEVGVLAHINTQHGQLQFILDHILDPEVIAGHLTLQPVGFFDASSYWRRYTIGATVALDIHAPTQFERVDAGVDLLQPNRVTDTRNLVPTEQEVTGVIGIENSFLLVQTDTLSFRPYLDVNTQIDGGSGLHLGLSMNATPNDTTSLQPRLEVRWLGEDYLPDYFSSFYEIERDSFDGFGSQNLPKRVALTETRNTSLIGAYAQLSTDIQRTLHATIAYEDYEGPNNTSILLRTNLTTLDPLVFGVMLRRIGFDGLDDAFELGNTLLVAESRYHILPWLSVSGRYNRLWRLQTNGQYTIVNDWALFTGASTTF